MEWKKRRRPIDKTSTPWNKSGDISHEMGQSRIEQIKEGAADGWDAFAHSHTTTSKEGVRNTKRTITTVEPSGLARILGMKTKKIRQEVEVNTIPLEKKRRVADIARRRLSLDAEVQAKLNIPPNCEYPVGEAAILLRNLTDDEAINLAMKNNYVVDTSGI